MDLVTSLPLAVLALVVEACLGYPHRLLATIGHPVIWIGRLIELCELRLNRAHRSDLERRLAGFVTLVLVLAITAGIASLLAFVAAELPRLVGLALTALLGSSLLAQRSLHAHVEAVAMALEAQGLDAGRAAVGRIVGRDVALLDATGVARAAIESLAENFSDAVIAPAFYLAALGLPGGACYKALNTADSMIGHKSERFRAFGFAAAKLDDLANLVPARLSALVVVVAALFLRDASPRNAWLVALGDSRGHPSPNAGWPEAAFAGALGLRLGGPRSYGNTHVADAWIGSGRDPTPRDILRALRLYRMACGVHIGLVASLALLFILRA